MADSAAVKRRQSESLVSRVIGGDENKQRYLYKPTVSDGLLAKTVLPFIPGYVTPNQITVFRLITIPFLIALLLFQSYALAGVLFAISAFSDAIDGAMARTRKQVTAWGILFDPLADKLLIGSTALTLVATQLSFFLAVTMVSLELALIASSYIRYKGKAVPAKTIGKIKMILQCVGIIFLFSYVLFGGALALTLATGTLYLAVLFALLSLLVYKSV